MGALAGRLSRQSQEIGIDQVPREPGIVSGRFWKLLNTCNIANINIKHGAWTLSPTLIRLERGTPQPHDWRRRVFILFTIDLST